MLLIFSFQLFFFLAVQLLVTKSILLGIGIAKLQFCQYVLFYLMAFFHFQIELKPSPLSLTLRFGLDFIAVWVGFFVGWFFEGYACRESI